MANDIGTVVYHPSQTKRTGWQTQMHCGGNRNGYKTMGRNGMRFLHHSNPVGKPEGAGLQYPLRVRFLDFAIDLVMLSGHVYVRTVRERLGSTRAELA